MLSLSDCGVAQIERLTKLPLVIPTLAPLQETRDYCFHSFRFPLISVPRTHLTIQQIAPGGQYCIAKHMFWLNNIFTWTGWTILYCEAKLQSAWLPDRQEGGGGGGFPVQPTLHLVQRAALQRNKVWRCNLSALWEQGGSKGSSQQVEIHFTLFCTEHTCGSTAQNVIYCGRWGSMVPIVDQLSSSPDIMSSPGDLEGDWAHQGKAGVCLVWGKWPRCQFEEAPPDRMNSK